MELLTDRSEKVTYDYPGCQVYIRRALLSSFPDYRAESHWHADLEFIYIFSGSMCYQINGEAARLGPGNGIFVNSRQLHFGFSPERRECDFLCMLLNPAALAGTEALRAQYVLPVLEAGPAWALLSEEIPWQRAVLEDLLGILARREEPGAPLYIQGAFLQIWQRLWQNLPREAPQEKPDHRLALVKKMAAFIRAGYPEKITLAQIASAGNISKSSCLQLFKTYMGDTPMNYLMRCRLEKAAALLSGTDQPISDIALSVGFSGASYFSESFRRVYRCTPRQFRFRANAPAVGAEGSQP